MKSNMTREQGLRWTAYVLVVLLVLAGAYAGMLFLKVDEAESALAVARKAAEDASASAARVQGQLKAANAKLADAEQKQRELEMAKVLLGKLEPDVVPVLEASARAGKPAAKGAALATIGVIGQVVHGPKHEAALNAYDRALVADKDNCAAMLGLALSGDNKGLTPAAECQALLPVAANGNEAKAAPAANDRK